MEGVYYVRQYFLRYFSFDICHFSVKVNRKGNLNFATKQKENVTHAMMIHISKSHFLINDLVREWHTDAKDLENRHTGRRESP